MTLFKAPRLMLIEVSDGVPAGILPIEGTITMQLSDMTQLH